MSVGILIELCPMSCENAIWSDYLQYPLFRYMNHLIVLRGYPASGKSTLGRELQRLGAGTFIDHNYLMKVVRAMAGEGDLIHQELNRLEMVMALQHLEKGESAILDGTYTTTASLMPLTALIEDTLTPMVVFRLDVSRESLLRRVVTPDREEEMPEFSSPELLDRWLAEHPYQPWYGEHIISGEGNSSTVANTIIKKLL